MSYSSAQIPKSFGDYQLKNIIQRHQSSLVALVYSEKKKQYFAAKIFFRNLLQDSFQLQILEKELRIMERIKHENIVNFEEIIYTDDLIIVVMEFIERFLNERIYHGSNISESHFFNMLGQIVSAISYLHERGIAHRDIKLDNIGITFDNKIKLIDFGMSSIKESHSIDSLRTTFCGTLEYIAPEILRGESYDAKAADIWSLGVVAYVLATGNLPFTGTEKLLIHSILSCEYSFPSFVSEEVKTLVRSMLQLDPTKRPTIDQIQKMIPTNIPLKQMGQLHHLPLSKKDLIKKPQIRLTSPNLKTSQINLSSSKYTRISISGKISLD
ncbi:CAMK family protein kinase [Trichomonas vaginalis G3]|uniref:CAMK family protein kinase n=1 Tax=Trichomonas vaginalis (strain ATCC PRA-98 / G3) TaxID=412133 RepID=A2F496_TRIV3|nr:protein serine/threonine kinase protein [Trichomonas vaginalis G3]EAY00275.1 CAMK family protein kinase [Trichomonas vaginalis G3]KAI5492723.1 protein serine/threonine kinase protein [Trichomonas vaginalis G3]|eukprot:XP_001313204.1 CAMK family protein kinase [Trichomonas vaginalis G3]